MLAEPAGRHRPERPNRIAGNGRCQPPYVNVVMRDKAVHAVHLFCRALARDGQISNHLYQRLVDLRHIAGENGPVVHLGVYVYSVV